MKPVEVELIQNHEDDDGFMEKMAKMMGTRYDTDRQRGPRLVGIGSFDHNFGKKWKELRAAKKEQLELLEREFKLKEERLIASLEVSQYAYETDLLRRELDAREANLQKNLMSLRGEVPGQQHVVEYCHGVGPSRYTLGWLLIETPTTWLCSYFRSSASLWEDSGRGNNPFSPQPCPPPPMLSSQTSLLGAPPSLLGAPPSVRSGNSISGMEIDRGPTHDGYGDVDHQKRLRRF